MPVKLFLDSAKLEEVKEVASWGILDGLTTNPSLIATQGGVDLESHLKTLCALVPGPVSMEVIATDFEGMMAEGRRYAGWAKNIVVKVPMTREGLKAVKALKEEGIKTNVTLIFSANQALLAAKAGASMVSPFIGRLDEAGQDGMLLVEEIVRIFENYAFDTEVLVASVRHSRHVTDAALIGAHIATLPKAVFETLIKHPLTDKGLEKFLADWQQWQTSNPSKA